MDGARSAEDAARCTESTGANQAIQQQEAIFSCNICFQTATHPVASICGHLFCWECLFTWLRGGPRPCPVCRTELIQGVNIIPIFTNTGVYVSPAEPQSSTNVTRIPQRPSPPPPHRIPRSIPLLSPPDRIPGPMPVPSPVGMNVNPVEGVLSNVVHQGDEPENVYTINFDANFHQQFAYHPAPITADGELKL